MDTVITFLSQHHTDTLTQDSNTGSRTEKLQQNQSGAGSHHTVLPGWGKSSFKPCHTETKQCSQMKNCQPDSTLNWVCIPSTSLPGISSIGLALPSVLQWVQTQYYRHQRHTEMCQGDPWVKSVSQNNTTCYPRVPKDIKTSVVLLPSTEIKQKEEQKGTGKTDPCSSVLGAVDSSQPCPETWHVPSCHSNKA